MERTCLNCKFVQQCSHAQKTALNVILKVQSLAKGA